MDCMIGMPAFPDKYFDLAVVDPPYGIGIDKNAQEKSGTQPGKCLAPKGNYSYKGWDKSAPDAEYFTELFRVSKNQIIFGANYFIDRIPYISPCWIIWDKANGENDFADCELAWTSFTSPVRRFTYRWAGMLQGNMKNKETRIHPTQKPVALYHWIYKNYAKPGERIIDTHAGSASSFVAAYDMGFDYIGFEIDPDYHAAAQDRIDKAMSQMRLYDTPAGAYTYNNDSIFGSDPL